MAFMEKKILGVIFLLFLNLVSQSQAIWQTSGGSSSRASQRLVSSFADPNTGVAVSHRLRLGLNAAFAPLETQSGHLVVTDAAGLAFYFIDPSSGSVVSTVNVSTSFNRMYISSPPSLDVTGTLVVLSMKSTNPDYSVAAAFSAEDTTGKAIGSLEWGPIDISGVVSASDPLITPNFALFVGRSGSFAKVDLTTQRVQLSSVQLCDQNDYISSAPTQLDESGLSFISVSNGGCVSAMNGPKVIWSLSRWQGAVGSVVAAPVVDYSGPNPNNTARVYWLYTGGAICCSDTSNGDNCDSWPDVCVTTTSNGFVYSGLSIAPDSFDWHGGAVYAADTSGSLIFASAVNGDTGSSDASTLPGPSYSSSVVLPDAWGAENNALLVLSSDSKNSVFAVSAWQVGSNGDRADDDPSDDDGQATTGLAWRLDLPKDLGSIQSRAGVCVLNDGRIIFISDQGDLVIVSNATTALEIDGSLAVIVTSVSVTFGVVIFTAAFVWSRRQRRLARLAMQNEKDDEEGGGEEGKDKATIATAESEGSSLDAPLLVSIN
jgi:hypothetical protein